MPPPENKTPFKTMNIKSALLAAASRKRKATSPNVPLKQVKSMDDTKSRKEGSDDEIEMIVEDSDIAAIGDCKENTDLNVVKSELEKLSPSLNNVQKDCVKSDTVQNSDLSACDRSLIETSDELNSSNLNNSVNVQEDSNELSENGVVQSKSVADVSPSSKKRCKDESTFKSPSEANQNETSSKKKRKMTSEEARQRSEAREQKRRESLAKKKLLDAEKLQKKLEKEQLRIQKEIERQEKENEKKAKEKLKLEKKEQEEREKQQKQKEKEDQKKMRQMQQEMKLEERKKKEELKLKKEELRKAEEEKQKAKLEKEQKEKEKLERNKAAFMKFFVASNKSTTAQVVPQVVEKEGAFKPFQVSDDMTLAPVVPPVAQERFQKDTLDGALECQDNQELYLQILKSGKYKDVRLRKRLRKQRACDDVIVIDTNEPSELFLKAKLLQFSENVRPPYWGTWRKQSSKIRPRNPWGQEDFFDYTVDSDDEWDEGGPGESLSGTENEIESEDDYEVDNEFFVPHGYLSAEEEKEEDEVESDPEKQKAKLKIKQQEFEMERKKKTTELKPLILGCYIENLAEVQDPNLCSFLQAYCGEMLLDSPILTCFTVKKLQDQAKLNSNSSSPVASSASVKKKRFPEEAMPHLIRLVHGNTNSRETLVKEFQSFWREQSLPENAETASKKPAEETVPAQEPNPDATTLSESKNISKRQLFILIKKIATYGKSSHPSLKKSCWYVHDEVREKYGLQDAPIPNEWTYACAREVGETTASPLAKLNCASIKEFLIP